MASKVITVGPRLPLSIAVRTAKSSVQAYEDRVFPDAKTTKDLAISKLHVALSTRKGERVMQPNLGNEIQTLVFNNFLNDIAVLGEQMIRDLVTTQVPEVEIISIRSQEMRGENAIVWTVTLRMKQNPTDTFSVQLSP
jgi:phage baseplate assembly protein W